MDKKHLPQKRKPEWVPDNASRAFATHVIEGKETSNISSPVHQGKKHKSPVYHVDELFEGIRRGSRTHLSRAITLIESNSHRHFEQAQALVKLLLPYSDSSIRLAVTGFPGVGKSTFIETFGTWLIGQEHKVAVLAIDPSSTISKGSILGDKTRMEKLARAQNSFIRPSPTSGVLGGVARKTRETIIACEAAGYDIILIETVGVGQSEITVRSMVDFFLLIQIAGAGDELQGFKKGIMELADLILVNKADGDNQLKAENYAQELEHLVHYLQPITPGWQVHALACSAYTSLNIAAIWDSVSRGMQHAKSTGFFEQRRKLQLMEWFDTMLMDGLTHLFYSTPPIKTHYQSLKQAVLDGRIPATEAVQNILNLYKQ